MDCMDLCSEFSPLFILAHTDTNRLERKAVSRISTLVCFQWWFCAAEAEKGGSRGRSFPRTLECSRLSPHHLSCPEQKWGKSAPTLLTGNYCAAVMVKIFSHCVYTYVRVAHRMERCRATSSFGYSTKVQCSFWRAGTENSPVWRSSQTASRPLYSSLARTASLSKNASCQDKQVCVY